MRKVPGTKGYDEVIEAFTQASYELKFEEVNEDFLELLPQAPGLVLDAGAGVGQNAAALAQLGYEVVAVEPLKEFLDIAKAKYETLDITWINDSLPQLKDLKSFSNSFDLILVDSVLHHLSQAEHKESLLRFSQLLAPSGICVMSLRNGPAGAGKHIFPTDSDTLADYACRLDLKVVKHLKNQPSKMKLKANVIWSRLALLNP